MLQAQRQSEEEKEENDHTIELPRRHLKNSKLAIR